MKNIQEYLKQGIEYECFIRDRDNLLKATKHFREGSHCSFVEDNYPLVLEKKLENLTWKQPHWDSGDSTEVDSKAYDNLEELKENIQEIFKTVYDSLPNTVIMNIGICPISEYAGGHIHLSHPRYLDIDLKNKLYIYQPFISLLSQNSSLERQYLKNSYRGFSGNTPKGKAVLFYHLYKKTNKKDTRIYLNNRDGGFCKKYIDIYEEFDYDCDECYECRQECYEMGEEPDCYNCDVPSQYIDYYEDENGLMWTNKINLEPNHGTLEVRYPSSNSLIQSLGIATFLKACIYQEPTRRQIEIENSIEDIPAIENLTIYVPQYGAKTKVELEYEDRKYRTTLGKLFYVMLHSEPFCYGLVDALSEINNSTATKIMNFYRIFGNNYSMTDYYNSIFTRYKDDIYKQCDILSKLNELEMLKEKEIIKQLEPIDTEVDMDFYINLDPTIYNIKEEDLHRFNIKPI